MTYTAKTFNLPELKGLSKEQIDVHLALYQGYVKNVNLLMETLGVYASYGDKASEGDKLAISELRRRLGFEFDGMRMHEYYFEQFEGGKENNGGGNPESLLTKAAKEKYGSGENFIKHIKEVAGTRGIGWTVVYYDPTGKVLHTAWVNDHEVGQLAGCPIILALDMWEHAYMVDYAPKDKMTYVDAFLENLNWSIAEKRFEAAV